MIRTGRAIWRDTPDTGFFRSYVLELNKRGVEVIVTQAADGTPIPTEVIAQDIADIAAAMKRIDGGKLTRKALIVLLAHETKIAQKDIKAVLDSLHSLGKIYLKP